METHLVPPSEPLLWVMVFQGCPTAAPRMQRPGEGGPHSPMAGLGFPLTQGHLVVRGICEPKQELWPLAAQLVGLVPGLQLHLCGVRGTVAHRRAPKHQTSHPGVGTGRGLQVTASVGQGQPEGPYLALPLKLQLTCSPKV